MQRSAMSDKLKPKLIQVSPGTITKHYLDYKTACETGTVRTLKPTKDTLIYACLPKGKEWVVRQGRASPPKGVRSTIVKTVVPKNAKYVGEVERWEEQGVPVEYRRDSMAASEPELSESERQELAAVEGAMGKAEEA